MPAMTKLPVKGCYEKGECPTCGETIPDTAAAGDECKVCGHTFEYTPPEPEPEKYEVVVGNVGAVYRGSDRAKAEETYNIYLAHSKSNRGRAGGETVTLFADGDVDPNFDYIPPGYGEEVEIDADDGKTPQQVADEDFHKKNPHDGDTE